MNELLPALLASVISLVGGYYFGVVRSRNERRDAAIAEIFKEMMLFYRGIQGWIDDPKGGPLVECDTSWEDHCWKRYAVFLDALHGYEIWLDEATYKLMQDFAHAGREVLNRFSLPRAVNEPDADRMAEWDRLRMDLLARRLNEATDAMKAEFDDSRYIIPYRIVFKKDEPNDGG